MSVAGKGTRAAAVAKDGALVSEEDWAVSGAADEEEAGPADWWLSWFACNIKSYSIVTEDPGNSMIETWVMKESDQCNKITRKLVHRCIYSPHHAISRKVIKACSINQKRRQPTSSLPCCAYKTARVATLCCAIHTAMQ